MSAYREMKTQLNDKRALIEALKKKGFEPAVHNSPVKLEGYHGDKRKQKAEIVIPRAQVGSASNDIGFTEDAHGNFTAIISQFDQGQGYNDRWLKEITGLAVEAKALRIAKTLGAKQLKRQELPGNKVRYVFEKG